MSNEPPLREVVYPELAESLRTNALISNPSYRAESRRAVADEKANLPPLAVASLRLLLDTALWVELY
ncbi:MAG: hypothetical protein ACT4NX_04025 [Deltaproteobacteria bacterium]